MVRTVIYSNCVFRISLSFCYPTDSVLIAFLDNTQIRLLIKILNGRMFFALKSPLSFYIACSHFFGRGTTKTKTCGLKISFLVYLSTINIFGQVLLARFIESIEFNIG